MLDVRRLMVLREVARRGSLSAAAEALSYTPSAVSQQIAALEREAGARLVERRPRGVRLTEPGRLLVAHAEEVLARLAAAERDLEALAGARGGRLRLGWFATAGGALVPQAIAAFRQRFPQVALELFEGDPDECVPMLKAGELELALVYQFELAEPLDPELELAWLLDDPLCIALPVGHRLAGRARVRLAELDGEPWIQGVRHGSTLDVLPRACHLAGFEPNIAFRTDDRMAVEGLVAAGVGIALVPRMTVPATRADIAVRPLVAKGLFRRVHGALPPGSYRPPAVLAMLETLREVCASLLEQAATRVG